MIGTALREILGQDAAVGALLGVGNDLRIYPLDAGNDPPHPYGIYQILTDRNERTKVCDHREATAVITVYTESYADVVQISKAIQSALDRYEGTAAGLSFRLMLVEEISDLYSEHPDLYGRNIRLTAKLN